jgi:hypothetical protein
MRCVSSGERV